jgi:hypothetical protein
MYKTLKLDLTPAQARASANGKAIKVKSSQIDSGDKIVFLHPVNYKLLMKAKKGGKGATLMLSAGEITATQQSDMEGTGLWSGLKTAYNWVKGNWGAIKPVLSSVGDAVATIAPQTAPVRGAIKALTGVGVKPAKGSPEMKEKMAMLRAKRKGKKTEGAGLFI